MADITSLAAWSAAHHGVITRATLARIGFSPQRIETMAADGLLRRTARSLYVVTTVPVTPLQRLAVASAVTGGAVSRVAAGAAWQYRRLPRDLAVDVTIEHRRTLDTGALPAWIRLHRSRSLPETDLVRRSDGIVLTSPPRTVFDLAAVLDRDALESIVEQGIDRAHFGIPTLWAVARRLARPGRDGSGRFVDVLASRPAWLRPVGSDHELVLERALIAIGLPRPHRQLAIELPNGQIVHPDLVWPEARLAVEVDHVTWHGGRLAGSYDKWRDRQLRRRRWEVERVPDHEVHHRITETAAEIAERYHDRLALLRARPA